MAPDADKLGAQEPSFTVEPDSFLARFLEPHVKGSFNGELRQAVKRIVIVDGKETTVYVDDDGSALPGFEE